MLIHPLPTGKRFGYYREGRVGQKTVVHINDLDDFHIFQGGADKKIKDQIKAELSQCEEVKDNLQKRTIYLAQN